MHPGAQNNPTARSGGVALRARPPAIRHHASGVQGRDVACTRPTPPACKAVTSRSIHHRPIVAMRSGGVVHAGGVMANSRWLKREARIPPVDGVPSFLRPGRGAGPDTRIEPTRWQRAGRRCRCPRPCSGSLRIRTHPPHVTAITAPPAVSIDHRDRCGLRSSPATLRMCRPTRFALRRTLAFPW